MSLFNLESPQKVSEKLIAGTDYLEVVDGNQTTRNYVNLNNEKYCKRDGYLEFIPMKMNKGIGGTFKHENVKMFRTTLDKKTGLTWGIPTEIDIETKLWKHQLIIVEGPIILNLSIKEQANIAACIKNSTFCEGSPNLIGDPTYKVLDKEKIAMNKVKEITYRRKAEDIIYSLDEDGLIEMALNIGVNVSANKKLSMLTAEVHRVMNLDPKKFVTTYEDPNRVYVSIFNKAFSINIITHNVQTGAYMFNGLPLGHSKEVATKYLMDNNQIATTIDIRSKEHDKETNTSMSVKEPVISNEVSEIEKLKAELADARIKLANAPAPTESFKAPFGDEISKVENENNEELISLRERAKTLKIKGGHLASKETLLRKIEEAEAE